MKYYDQLEQCLIEILGTIDDRVMCKVTYSYNEQEFREFDKSFIEHELELGNYTVES